MTVTTVLMAQPLHLRPDQCTATAAPGAQPYCYYRLLSVQSNITEELARIAQ